MKLLRVRAWVSRFMNNVRSKDRTIEDLTPEEIADAEAEVIGEAQAEVFEGELQTVRRGQLLPARSGLGKLQPRLDDSDLLRCDGRTQLSQWLPYDTRYPIILPRKHWVTQLIVKHHHELQQHGGTNGTLSSLSARFWIEAAREEIRDWERKCMGCARRKATAASQVMAPLPKSRLRTPLRAFARCSVDYSGPFLTRCERGRSRHKRYLCLFTCMLSRAVHLEMSYGLDVQSFLNAFSRMVSRRGLPFEIFSDNGRNFVAADRELKELVQQLDDSAIHKSLANRGVAWHFNPPLAPHFGGVHEVMIKAAKRAIKAILGSTDITDKELATAIAGAESLINSRPLTYQAASPGDNVPLTPNHFLIGQAGGQFSPDNVDTTQFSPRQRLAPCARACTASVETMDERVGADTQCQAQVAARATRCA